MNELSPKISQDTIYQIACSIKALRNSFESYALERENNPEIEKKFYFSRITVSEKKTYRFDIAVQETANFLRVGIQHVSKDKYRLSTDKYEWLMNWGWEDPKITYPFYFKNFNIRTDQEIYQTAAEIILTAISVFDFTPLDPLSVEMFESKDTFTQYTSKLKVIFDLIVVLMFKYFIDLKNAVAELLIKFRKLIKSSN